MGPNATRATRPADQSLNDMVASLAQEAIGKGSTALLDDEMGSFGVPNPRILIVGCGGSGNNTLNRITHLGVEGAITVAINTCLLYTSPSPRDGLLSRMPSSA